MLRALVAVILLAAGGWSGNWVWQSSLRRQAVDRWMQDLRASGWEAQASNISVRGFPNRLDTTFTEARLVSPDGARAWSAPFLQIIQLVYDPSRSIVVWPHRQVLGQGDARRFLDSRDMRASLQLRPERGEFDHGTVEMTDAVLTRQDRADRPGADAAVARMVASFRTRDAAANAYDVALTATDVRLPSADASRLLPAVIGKVQLEGTARLDAPASLQTATGTVPRLKSLEIGSLRVEWGALSLRAGGALTVGAGGLLSGRVAVKARNWRRLLDQAVQAGLLPESAAGPVTTMLQVIAEGTGNPKTLDTELTIEDGVVYLGMIPLASLPPL